MYKKGITTIVLIVCMTQSLLVSAQKMDNKIINTVIEVVADSIRGQEGNWQFMIKNRLLICITDQQNNRMRIISPIIEQKKLAYVDMLKLMEANYHTALDVKYAISDDLLWSVYIHPLRELNKKQLLNAINQVYTAAETYGTTYNSTGLAFPNRREALQTKNKKKI